jgi:hypothetical protein
MRMPRREAQETGGRSGPLLGPVRDWTQTTDAVEALRWCVVTGTTVLALLGVPVRGRAGGGSMLG